MTKIGAWIDRIGAWNRRRMAKYAMLIMLVVFLIELALIVGMMYVSIRSETAVPMQAHAEGVYRAEIVAGTNLVCMANREDVPLDVISRHSDGIGEIVIFRTESKDIALDGCAARREERMYRYLTRKLGLTKGVILY